MAGRRIKTKEEYEAKQKIYEERIKIVEVPYEESIPVFLKQQRSVIMHLEAEREESSQRVWDEVKDLPIGGPHG